ncbi:lamin tail domain-containing protein [Streptomyces sp. NPDC056600]|uniref:lamin tail domain-containing protein n=1 Tax=Streptomyces sp. NPDC056600 TaxID=3345874 RepID=UPI0036A96398
MPKSGDKRARWRHAAQAITATGAAGAFVLTPLPQAFAAPSGGAVIAEVYGGGGNSGATLTRDFIELGNAGGTAVDLSGYSVQYLPGSPSATSRWSVTRVTGSIAAGGRYLIAEAQGTGGTTALPTPDASGSIAMSGTSGTVALVAGTDELACKTAADCATDERIVDLVGFGTAAVRETSPVTGASNTASVARAASLADTDDNSADLTAGAPTPVNAKGETPGTGGGGGGEEPGDPGTPGAVRVHDIQGTTRRSPLTGESVTNVPGIVIGVRDSGSKGFWIQDTQADADPRTSEALFVYTGSAAPTVKAGDSVLVSGKVAEYAPSSTTQSITQISGPKTSVLSSGNAVPAAVVLGPANLPDDYAPDAGGGSIESLPLQPALYALDFLEATEGMRVQVADARVVGATTEYDEVYVTARPEQNPSVRGGTVYLGYDGQNSGRVKIESLGPEIPEANVGDTLAGATTGPLDYDSYGGYTLMATELGSHVSGGLEREVTRPQRDKELAIATYNVENLDALDPQEKFDRLAEGVAVNLAAPDVVALEEIQDDNGATDDGTVSSEQTLARFTDAIVAAGGPRYSWRYVAPQDKADGGEPGGNIRQVLLYNEERLTFTDRAATDASAATEVVATRKGAQLSVSPGRIAPASDAWKNSRKPLVGEFKFHGEQVFVIANHFASKGGDAPMHGKLQEPSRSSEELRHQQAQEVHDFVAELLAADPKAKVVVLGDINDFQFSKTTEIMTGDGSLLTPLVNTLPVEERYTYVYEGNSQTLDQTLVSPSVVAYDYDIVHLNAEFADQASDHDPQVVRIDVKKGRK